jgi:phage-related protein
MTWTVTFFNHKVREETLNFPDGILANLLHILEMIEEFGPNLGRPHTAPMGGGLFEIRAKGREGVGRSLFCTVNGSEVIILTSFVKRSQKTPQHELNKAYSRMKELRND